MLTKPIYRIVILVCINCTHANENIKKIATTKNTTSANQTIKKNKFQKKIKKNINTWKPTHQLSLDGTVFVFDFIKHIDKIHQFKDTDLKNNGNIIERLSIGSSYYIKFKNWILYNLCINFGLAGTHSNKITSSFFFIRLLILGILFQIDKKKIIGINIGWDIRINCKNKMFKKIYFDILDSLIILINLIKYENKNFNFTFLKQIQIPFYGKLNAERLFIDGWGLKFEYPFNLKK